MQASTLWWRRIPPRPSAVALLGLNALIWWCASRCSLSRAVPLWAGACSTTHVSMGPMNQQAWQAHAPNLRQLGAEQRLGSTLADMLASVGQNLPHGPTTGLTLHLQEGVPPWLPSMGLGSGCKGCTPFSWPCRQRPVLIGPGRWAPGWSPAAFAPARETPRAGSVMPKPACVCSCRSGIRRSQRCRSSMDASSSNSNIWRTSCRNSMAFRPFLIKSWRPRPVLQRPPSNRGHQRCLLAACFLFRLASNRCCCSCASCCSTPSRYERNASRACQCWRRSSGAASSIAL